MRLKLVMSGLRWIRRTRSRELPLEFCCARIIDFLVRFIPPVDLRKDDCVLQVVVTLTNGEHLFIDVLPSREHGINLIAQWTHVGK